MVWGGRWIVSTTTRRRRANGKNAVIRRTSSEHWRAARIGYVCGVCMLLCVGVRGTVSVLY